MPGSAKISDQPPTADLQRAWLEVDLSALVANARTIAATAGAPLLPMVKANGYGVGAVAAARALEAVEPWGFGVATVGEAAELREAGITRPIVVFTPWVGGRSSVVGRDGVRPVIGDIASLETWLRATDHRPPTTDAAPFHLEIDTGMARSGIRWDDREALQRAAELLADRPEWEGVFTHFHSAESDPGATDLQWDRFMDALCWFPARPPLVHAANSAGALRGKAFAADLVRPGIYLYGGGAGELGPPPRPVATLRCRVAALRTVQLGDTVSYNGTWVADGPRQVATLSIGYADGLLRSGSNRLRVEVNGQVVPVVGRVTMDMTMVALPPGAADLGDVVTIFGGKVTLADHAEQMGTNVYEALTAIGPRVPRIHR
ncbi:MAG TPA: alanine racemase [Gemmatimonadales bacterium]|nr:alanine racemase [Gemmatimonadales bacterium]